MKGSELDLNMMGYIQGKEWDAKLLEALISERMKPGINANVPMPGNTSKENLFVLNPNNTGL